MKTSANGRALIEAFEGLYLKAYHDSAGVLTIGYGHTNAAGPPKVVPGMRITTKYADEILSADLATVEKEVARAIHVPLTQWQFDALVSFHFNTGAISKGTVDDKLNHGNVDAAMRTLRQYQYAGGHLLRGLTRRREAEELLFRGSVMAALALAEVPPTKVDELAELEELAYERTHPVKKKTWVSLLQCLLNRLSRI